MTPTVPTQRDPSSALVIRDTQEMEWFAKVPIKSIVSSSRKTCFLLVVVSIKAVEADQWGIGLSDLQFFKICYKWSFFTSLIFRSHVTSFFFFLGGGGLFEPLIQGRCGKERQVTNSVCSCLHFFFTWSRPFFAEPPAILLISFERVPWATSPKNEYSLFENVSNWHHFLYDSSILYSKCTREA